MRPTFTNCLLAALLGKWAQAHIGASVENWDANQLTLDTGHRGAVASETQVCSEIGADLLERGGNAVDAFIGTQLCVGVIGMHHSGIGGGGFALIRSSQGEYTVLDHRETAPAAARLDMFNADPQLSVFGGLAAGIPGELRGLSVAHQKFGSLPWQTIVTPAANVALNGFLVTSDVAVSMAVGIQEAGWNFLVEDPSWAVDFAPNGTLLGPGDTLTRKRFGETLLRIAEEGAEIFYAGEMANSTIRALEARGGIMTLDDLAGYEVELRDAVSVDYRNFTVFSSGAPSNGALALSALKIMEGYPAVDAASDGNLTVHRFTEALRSVYAARTLSGDPGYVPKSIELEKSMISEEGANHMRSKTSDDTTRPVESYFASLPPPFDKLMSQAAFSSPEAHGTSHISTLDNTGMAVSSTTTINLFYGNLICVPETGIILNNEMNDFSIPHTQNEFGYPPSPANFVAPGKRPLSSITPIIVEDKVTKSLYLVVGAAGGSRILSSSALTTWRVLEQGLDLEEAIRRPRFHDQLMPNRTVFEWAFDNATVAEMQERGHDVVWHAPNLSSVQGVRVMGQGVFEAVGETRQHNSGGKSV